MTPPSPTAAPLAAPKILLVGDVMRNLRSKRFSCDHHCLQRHRPCFGTKPSHMLLLPREF